MAEKNPLLINNFIEAAKLGQRALYVSYVAVVLWGFVTSGNLPVVDVPWLGVRLAAPAGAIALLGLYFASGCVVFFALDRCSEIMAYHFDEKQELALYPSLILMEGLGGAAVLLLPFFTLFVQFRILYQNESPWPVILVTVIVSAFHFMALIRAAKLHWRKQL
jgi:hypothetical protein